MGASGNWLKSFISHKKPNINDKEKVVSEKRSKKWKPWRSSSSSDSGLSVNRAQVAASESSDFTTPTVNDVYTAAIAALIRASPKDFLIIRQEWAAIRIQTAFRALLARRALRALKALVRLQAIFRGRLVRKQAAMTLKCMQALVRAQAQIKARRVRMSLEGESIQKKLENQSDPIRHAEAEWCNKSMEEEEEVKMKQRMRQEAANKRERATAYYISQQQLRVSPKLNPGEKDSFSGLIKPNWLDESISTWSWMNGWMTSNPWENRLIEEEEEAKEDLSWESAIMSPLSPEHEKGKENSKPRAANSDSFDRYSVGDVRNNTTRRVAARPLREVSYSSSLLSSSTATEGIDETASSDSVGLSKSRYMNLTSSNRAKQRGGMDKTRHRGSDSALHKGGCKINGLV